MSTLEYLDSLDKGNVDSSTGAVIQQDTVVEDTSTKEVSEKPMSTLDYLDSLDSKSKQDNYAEKLSDTSDIDTPVEKTNQQQSLNPEGFGETILPVPLAYDPSEPVSVVKKEPYDSSYRSGFDRTKKAVTAYQEALSNEEGEELTEVEIDELAGYISEALSTDTAMRRASPGERALGGIIKKFPSFGLKALAAFQVGGSAAMDVVEYYLEKSKDLDEKRLGGMAPGYNGLKSVINSLRGGPNVQTPKEVTDFIGEALIGSLDFIETLPAVGVFGSVISATTSAPKKIAKANKKIYEAEAAEIAAARRNNPGGANLATIIEKGKTKELAQEVAIKNPKITNDLIIAFEIQNKARDAAGKVINPERLISKEVNNKLEIDTTATRRVGKETARTITERDGDLFDLSLGDDVITSPILDPDKFNGIVAVAKDLQELYPTIFNNSNTLIDNLLEVTVSKDLKLDGAEFIDTLDKYGVSFEDYVLTVVSGGSEAGTTLQKLSQIRKRSKKSKQADKDKEKDSGVIRRTVMRIENIRRGGLVSQIATASRNLTSAGIRMPLESLGNVMDNAIYAFNQPIRGGVRDGTGGIVGGAKELFSGENWKDSFRGMRYIFSRPDIAEGYTDLILKSPEMAKQFDSMYNNINEIQKMTGRGGGGVVDNVLSSLEDGVDFLNTPNRWQEYLVRRGAFFSEMERLVKREYKIDLVDALNDGKLPKLLNDASEVKPKDARSFIAIVDEATNRALDVTYAKQPDIPVFRATSQFITRNGLTVVIPFPRFMFNSMELMGQYAGGASIPLTRKVSDIVTGGRIGGGPLTTKDRQRITRNLQGMAAVGAAYYYRTSAGALADYEQVPVGDDAQMDTTATYPMAQFLYAGEATKRLIDGTFDDWFDGQEFVELFTGSNFRAGVGNSVLEEIAQIADATDLTTGEALGRAIGRPLGNYLSTWAVPLGQIIDGQRATGLRDTEFKESAQDPDLSFTGTLKRETLQPLRNRGVLLSREEESELPRKEYAGYYDGRERMYPGAKVLGLSMTTRRSDDAEYLAKLGLDWRDLNSKSKVPSIKNFEIKMLNEMFMPTIVEIAREIEEDFRTEYKKKDEDDPIKMQFTENEFASNKLRPLIKKRVTKFKASIRDGTIAQGDDYAVALTRYRRIRPDFRKLATTAFIENFGSKRIQEGKEAAPDPLDAEDLNTLIKIAQAYSKAYSK